MRKVSRSYARQVKFQRRHFEYLVGMFRSIYRNLHDDPLALRAVAEEWAAHLRYTNNRFDREKFVDACAEGFK